MGLNRRAAAGWAIAGRPARATSRPSAASGGWLPIARAIPAITIAALTCSTLSAQAAEVYRWTDERGIVNYSNEPPPKGATAKDVRTVEDRLSIYTPEKLPERAPASAQKAPPSTSAREMQPPERRRHLRPGPLAYDPCVNVRTRASVTTWCRTPGRPCSRAAAPTAARAARASARARSRVNQRAAAGLSPGSRAMRRHDAFVPSIPPGRAERELHRQGAGARAGVARQSSLILGWLSLLGDPARGSSGATEAPAPPPVRVPSRR